MIIITPMMTPLKPKVEALKPQGKVHSSLLCNLSFGACQKSLSLLFMMTLMTLKYNWFYIRYWHEHTYFKLMLHTDWHHFISKFSYIASNTTTIELNIFNYVVSSYGPSTEFFVFLYIRSMCIKLCSIFLSTTFFVYRGPSQYKDIVLPV